VFRNTGRHCSFTVEPAHELINPVFVLEDWLAPRAEISLGQSRIEEREFASSWHGGKLILWLDRSIARRTEVSIAAP
jgi:hypothetical protein